MVNVDVERERERERVRVCVFCARYALRPRKLFP
jgi:hypothetical protein